MTKDMAEECLALRKTGLKWHEIKTRIKYMGTWNNLALHIRRYEKDGYLPKIKTDTAIPIKKSDLQQYAKDGLTVQKVAEKHFCKELEVIQKCNVFSIKLDHEKPKKRIINEEPVDMDALKKLVYETKMSNGEIAKVIGRSKSFTGKLIDDIRKEEDRRITEENKRLLFRMVNNLGK